METSNAIKILRDIITLINLLESNIIYISESKNYNEIRRICDDLVCGLATLKSLVLLFASFKNE